eukprot:INCI6173.3.p2 GENE.INCI6173.3~~INCI6173.3.p2  ORF type:complete len:153 (-),score=15.13 INCI6173.3:30-488(-)
MMKRVAVRRWRRMAGVRACDAHILRNIRIRTSSRNMGRPRRRSRSVSPKRPPFQSKRQQEAETHHIRSSTVALHPVPAPTSLYCATWIGVAFAQAKRAPTKQANGRLHGNFPARSTKILAPEGVQVSAIASNSQRTQPTICNIEHWIRHLQE